MDVRPIVSPQPVGSVEQVAPLRTTTPHAPPVIAVAAVIAATIDMASLLQLSTSDMGKLIRILDPSVLPLQASQSQDLLRGAISTAQSGDVRLALEQLAEFVQLDPSRAQSLRTEPRLDQLRTEVNHLLIQLETVAGLGAQGRLADATQVLESLGPHHQLEGWDTPPQTLMTMANRLYDAGGYVNYVHAASLAQVVIRVASPGPVGTVRTQHAGSRLTSDRRPKPGFWLRTFWIRAPLLILLASWFVFGLSAAGAASMLHYFWPSQFPATLIDTGFALWGIGFLVLVAFGFYMRVRHIRFR